MSSKLTTSGNFCLNTECQLYWQELSKRNHGVVQISFNRLPRTSFDFLNSHTSFDFLRRAMDGRGCGSAAWLGSRRQQQQQTQQQTQQSSASHHSSTLLDPQQSSLPMPLCPP